MTATINKILKTAAGSVLSVEPLNDPVVQSFRMNTCRSCGKFDPSDQTCTVCGCFMDVKTTLLTNRNPKRLGRVEETHCPEGRWNDKEIANYYRQLDGKPVLP